MHVCLFLLALGEGRRNGMGSGSWGRSAPCPGVSGLLDSPWKPQGWPCALMEPDAHPVTRAPQGLSKQWIKQMNAATMPQCKFSEGKRRENRRSSAGERSQSKAYLHAESVAGSILMGAMGITSGGHPLVPTCLCREHEALLSFLLRIRAASACRASSLPHVGEHECLFWDNLLLFYTGSTSEIFRSPLRPISRQSRANKLRGEL